MAKDEKTQSFDIGLNAEGNSQDGLSLFATVAQSVKTIIGAGILSLSWAFCQSSLWPGLFLSVTMCLLAAYTFYILGVCSEITGKKTYGEIWKSLYGEGSAWIPNLIVFMLTALSLVAYFTIIGDYLPLAIQGILGESVLVHRRLAILGIWAVFLPLHFRKDLSFLGCLSIIGTLGTLYTVVLLFAKTVERSDQFADDWEPFKLGPGVFLTIPSLAFAFNGHFNAPDIYQRLQRRSSSRWLVVTASAFGLCLLITFVCGVSGYLMFGSELKREGRSNVLTAPQLQGRPEVMLAYLATCVSISLGIPLYARSACDSLELLFLGFSGSTEALGSDRNRSNCVMIVVLLATMGTSMVLDDLGLINAIAGAVCASMNMFVLPSLMYMKVAGQSRELTAGLPLHSKLVNWTSVVIGVLVAVTGVTTSIMDAMGFQM